MTQNDLSVLCKAAYAAYARYEAAEASKAKAVAKAEAEAAKVAFMQALVSNAINEVVRPQIAMFWEFILPGRLAKKDCSYGAVYWYVGQALRHEGATSREIKYFLEREQVLALRAKALGLSKLPARVVRAASAWLANEGNIIYSVSTIAK